MTAVRSLGQLAANICGGPKSFVRNEITSMSAWSKHCATLVSYERGDRPSHRKIRGPAASAYHRGRRCRIMCCACSQGCWGRRGCSRARRGSTALSAGLIPAAGTRFQRAKGINDSPQLFADDIQHKAKGQSNPTVVDAVARGASLLVEWLANRLNLPFDVVDSFNYPGHSAYALHA